jgi:hypothetical protein
LDICYFRGNPSEILSNLVEFEQFCLRWDGVKLAQIDIVSNHSKATQVSLLLTNKVVKSSLSNPPQLKPEHFTIVQTSEVSHIPTAFHSLSEAIQSRDVVFERLGLVEPPNGKTQLHLSHRPEERVDGVDDFLRLRVLLL